MIFMGKEQAGFITVRVRQCLLDMGRYAHLAGRVGMDDMGLPTLPYSDEEDWLAETVDECKIVARAFNMGFLIDEPDSPPTSVVIVDGHTYWYTRTTAFDVAGPWLRRSTEEAKEEEHAPR